MFLTHSYSGYFFVREIRMPCHAASLVILMSNPKKSGFLAKVHGTYVNLYALPSIVALVFKLVLLAYAAKSPARNSLTKAYLAFLIILSLYNLIESVGFIYHIRHGLTPLIQKFGFMYIALLIPAIAVLLHISLRLSFDLFADSDRRQYLVLLYLPVIPLEYLLLFTDKLVLGFAPYLYTILRVPGPLYFVFETYVLVYLSAAVVNLVYGARGSRTSILRTRNRLWLLAMTPMALLFIYLIIANHFGVAKLTSTFHVPIAMTFFLVVTAYATHQHRLFDIEFYIPWSKIRRRKTEFYKRISAVVAEIADLRSVQKAVHLLSETLRCPIAVMNDSGKSALAAAGGTPQMAQFPREELRKIDHIVVADEIADGMPETSALMRRHGVAAIVPFYPHNQGASGWMLLGESFSESVYTARDFKAVERVFAKMAELFLDGMVLARSRLADSNRRLRTLDQRLRQTEENLSALRNENQDLRETIARMREEHIAMLNATVFAQGAGMRTESPAVDRKRPAKQKTLEDYVAEFEARIIGETLKCCGGNKSKAARLLGLRPNTLHYKIERYGQKA